jgi:hypothetical protein
MPALPTRGLVLPFCTNVNLFPNRFALETFGKKKTTFKYALANWPLGENHNHLPF